MEIFEEIKSDISSNPIMVYMKGEMNMPECGFSAAVMGVFAELKADIQTKNVLTNPELREGIKQFSNWPTIPQVYIDGKFVGGCDIVLELHKTGELAKMINQS